MRVVYRAARYHRGRSAADQEDEIAEVEAEAQSGLPNREVWTKRQQRAGFVGGGRASKLVQKYRLLLIRERMEEHRD